MSNVKSHTCVDVSVQLYDQVSVAHVTLMNTGRVGFDFVGVGMDPCFETSPKPGVAFMMPHMVCIMHFVSLSRFSCSELSVVYGIFSRHKQSCVQLSAKAGCLSMFKCAFVMCICSSCFSANKLGHI